MNSESFSLKKAAGVVKPAWGGRKEGRNGKTATPVRAKALSPKKVADRRIKCYSLIELLGC
jgi:hypothetical protein